MDMVGKETLSGSMSPPSLRSGNRTSLGVSVSQTVTLGRVPEIPQAAHLTCREIQGTEEVPECIQPHFTETPLQTHLEQCLTKCLGILGCSQGDTGNYTGSEGKKLAKRHIDMGEHISMFGSLTPSLVPHCPLTLPNLSLYVEQRIF